MSAFFPCGGSFAAAFPSECISWLIRACYLLSAVLGVGRHRFRLGEVVALGGVDRDAKQQSALARKNGAQ